MSEVERMCENCLQLALDNMYQQAQNSVLAAQDAKLEAKRKFLEYVPEAAADQGENELQHRFSTFIKACREQIRAESRLSEVNEVIRVALEDDILIP